MQRPPERTPLVSVIVPAYNPGPLLDKAIETIVAQTLGDWEIVVTDDGSKEDLSRIARLHPRITVIRQPNRGLSIARNAAILQSSGRYLAFLDADDLWRPGKLERQVELMESRPEVGMCHTQFDTVDGEGKVVGPGFGKAANSYVELLHQCTVCVSTAMVRRESLSVSGLFDPLYSAVQDYDVWLKIARHFELAFVDEVLASYRVHGGGMSRNYLKIHSDTESLLSRHAQAARLQGQSEAERAARVGLSRNRVGYGCQAFDLSREALRRREMLLFAWHLKNAFRLAPRYTSRALVGGLFRRPRR